MTGFAINKVFKYIDFRQVSIILFKICSIVYKIAGIFINEKAHYDLCDTLRLPSHQT